MLPGTDPPRRSPPTHESKCSSRLTLKMETRPHQHPAEPEGLQHDQRYGPHSVDLFATRDNRLLDRFVSWRLDPSAIAVDAFMLSLKGENPYCFPPVTCISWLLREVLWQQVMITLVALDWQAAWRPDLRRVLLEPPLRLPTDSILSVGLTLPNSRVTC